MEAQLSGAGITEICASNVTGSVFASTAGYNYPTGSSAGIYRNNPGSFIWELITPVSSSVYTIRTVYCDHRGYVWMSFWGNPFNTREKLYLSTNNGGSWTMKDSVETSNNIFSITVDSVTNYVYIGTRNGVERSTDGGNSFTLFNSGYPQSQWARHLENAGNGIVFVSTYQGVYKSTNHGQNWGLIPGMNPSDTAGAICIDRSAILDGGNSRLICGASSGSDLKGYKSDFGYAAIFLSVTLTGIVPSSFEVEAIKAYWGNSDDPEGGNSYIFVCTYPRISGNGAVLYSTNGGSNFTQLNAGLTNPITPSSIVYNKTNQKLYCGYFGNHPTGAKLWSMDLTVGVNQISSVIPAEFKLSQNYPNPFNPETIIKFSLKSQSPVRIVVYNSAGKEIAVLVDQSLSAGTYETKFNATGLSAGVYFYRMFVNGEYHQGSSGKMVLIN